MRQRLAEVRFIDVNTGIILSTHNVPYGSKLYADGRVLAKVGISSVDEEGA